MDKKDYESMKEMSHDQLRRLHEEAKKTSQERRKLHSRRQLSNMLTKKFKTTMIGSIASFEDGFGELWGHGKPLDDLTEEQVSFRDVWEQIRTEILNKGNSQLRAALEEINYYDLNWQKYRAELVVKPQDTEE